MPQPLECDVVEEVIVGVETKGLAALSMNCITTGTYISQSTVILIPV